MQVMLPGGLLLKNRTFSAVVMPDEGARGLLHSLAIPETLQGLVIPGSGSDPQVQADPADARDLKLLLKNQELSFIWVKINESWFIHDTCRATDIGALLRTRAEHALVVVQGSHPGPAFAEIARHADRLITITPWIHAGSPSERTRT